MGSTTPDLDPGLVGDTDVDSLVPMNLDPETPGEDEPDHPDNAEDAPDVAVPVADLTGDVLPDIEPAEDAR